MVAKARFNKCGAAPMKEVETFEETIYLDVEGRSMDVHIAAPHGEGPHPGVLLMFHRGGMDACTAYYMKHLPAAGYLTMVPNFYHHCPKEVPLHDCKKFLKDPEIISEIAAAADYSLARPDLDRSRFFIMGHCMGGRLAFLGASTKPVFTAAVAYYSGGMMNHWGEGAPTPFELISQIRCPVYGFFGNLDSNPSPADVDRFEAQLKRHNIPYLFHRYPNVGHGFQNAARRRTPEEIAAGDVAWTRMLDLMSAPEATPDSAGRALAHNQ
jgi:carboxymethylenebutenolidase